MNIEKAGLYGYGLDLKSFLNKNIDKPSELLFTISPNRSHSFYVVALSNRGVDGVVRAGFELQELDLPYKINNHEIKCGRVVKTRSTFKRIG